jgi:hypothetical protein
MPYSKEKFNSALSDSFKEYQKTGGVRNNKKLIPLHGYLVSIVKEIWGEGYEFHYHSGGNEVKGKKYLTDKRKIEKIKNVPVEEISVLGQYYDKMVDIVVTFEEIPIFCLGIKFVMSNYIQNANNYFESMMGETANIQRKEIPYAHILILRRECPYKDENGSVMRTEIIKEEHLTKYSNLVNDLCFPHKPHTIGIYLVDIDESIKEVTTFNMQNLSSTFQKIMQNTLSIENLFEQMSNYKDFYLANKEISNGITN